MYSWRLDFSHEESVGDSTLISLFIKVDFENKNMKDVLYVEGLFSSIVNQGFQPLFTCSCGNFGCGGYHVKVAHLKDGIILSNSYKPVKEPEETDLIDTFEFKLSWEDLYQIASEVYDQICLIKDKYPEFTICSGAYGDTRLNNLDKYRVILKELRDKCDGAGI